MAAWLVVKNWADHQHYADRNPSWIKLHRALLDDYEFCALPDHAKGHLVLIWLFASQHSGRVPNDARFLERKIGLNKTLDLDQLVSAGFLIPEHSASTALAGCYQGASETLALEEERRGEKKRKKSKRCALPDGFSISPEVRAWSEAEGHDFPDASLAYFRDWATASGKVYADWDAALRNCIKGDWGDARARARKKAATAAGSKFFEEAA